MIQISNGSLLGIGEILKDKTNGYGPRGYLWIYIARSVEEETKWLDMDRLNKALDNIQFVSSLRIRLELF